MWKTGNLNNNKKNPTNMENSEVYYSIAKVHVTGYDELEDFEKEYIRDRLEVGTHVYLRNEFDNPNNCHALQVMRHSNLIGYVDPKMAETIHLFLREGKIGDVIVSNIKSNNFKLNIDLKVYYEDPHGDKDLPYYPLEGRNLSVFEIELWTGQEDWTKDWFLNPLTDELFYKYRKMYDSSVDDSEITEVELSFSSWLRNYLNGTCITEKGCDLYLNWVKSDSAKKVLMKRIESYLQHKEYHFAEKEMFSDEEEDTDTEDTFSNSLSKAKQYDDIFVLSYVDGQGQLQEKTIKNANFFSFIAGLKYRENYEALLARLSAGMKLKVKLDPENEYDPNAIAVYNGKDFLGYIPKRDIPAVFLCMEDDELEAEIEYIEDDYVSLIIPANFQKLSSLNNEDLGDLRYKRIERKKYEIGAYTEGYISISKEEFLEGVKQQKNIFEK